jgi:putative tryptophan/tyrosine transport system substrate-binding protein
MRRREFIAGLGGAAAWPVVARGQQQALPVVGYLTLASREWTAIALAPYLKGLREAGYIAGQNVSIEFRYADWQEDRLPDLAADLVRREPAVVIAAGGDAALRAVEAVTTTIPIVCGFGDDPVKSGHVAALNRPGGNITGVVLFSRSLGGKRLELLREVVADRKPIAVLFHPSDADQEYKTDLNNVQSAARAVGQDLFLVGATSEHDFEAAFASMVRAGAGALLVMAAPFFSSQRQQLVNLATRYAMPAIYEWREFALDGGLMSYGSSLADARRQLGIYTGKILSGARPADLPVMQSVKVELVLNLKTAKTLGITFPLSLLGRADEVIE